MGDTKQDVVDMLRELAELTELDEGDPQSFRVRAYEAASRAIAAHAGDPGALTVKELQQISGVGKSTAEKIRELLDTGRVAKLEALRTEHPAQAVALLRIPGIGPKALARMRSELGVDSLDKLRAAIAERKLRALPGFGAKSEEKVARALARMDAEGTTDRTPISVALPIAVRIAERLRQVPGVVAAEYTGSLRRFCESVADIDVVAAATEPEPVMEALVSMRLVDRVLVRGPAKTSVVTRSGTQVDLRVVAPHQLGAALIYFTGSKGHNIKLRQRALARGLTLNEYALSEIEGGRAVATATEEEIYAALGLAWIPPVLREDTGEIEAAERGALPRPLGPVIGDFHVHTSLSGDGRSTLEEVVAEARARGCRVLAITDHAEGTRPGVGRDALLAQRARIRELQASLGDSLALLHGVELNIGPNGELDYDAEFRSGFDWCLASVHDYFDQDRAAQTRRVVTAMRDPSRSHDRPSLRAHDRRTPSDRRRPRRDLRGGRGDRHRARDQRIAAAPRPLRRRAAPRERPRRHVRAHERRPPGARARARALCGAQRGARVDAARARSEHVAGRAPARVGAQSIGSSSLNSSPVMSRMKRSLA